METFLIKTVQLLLSLSILVIFHEFGHFIFARMFKVRVEKFYLFFDPWFSLFKFKPKNSYTEYGIGWLPFGGYVKISGMIDESMDREQMSQPPKPWEFRSKPAWQRLLIMVAGVVFNFILAVFIYSMIVYTWGTSYIPFKNAYAGMEYCESARNIGFQNGDIPLSADGVDLNYMSSETLQKIVDAKEVKVLRDYDTVTIEIPKNFMLRLIDKEELFALYRIPSVVFEASPNTGAARAGLQKGDHIESIDGEKASSLNEMHKILESKPNTSVSVVYSRGSEVKTTEIMTDSLGRLGIAIAPLSDSYAIVTEHYGFWESFPKGIELGVDKLKSYVSSMKYVFTKEGAQSLGGFGAIGSIFPATWDWEAFWSMTAFLSVILAFMNILPIPALDGGHVLFLLYEVITRRKPNDKFMEYAQMGGMLFLFALLIYANGNDIFRFFFK